MTNIENAFRSNSDTVYGHFQRPGVGFYIPLYQREYSWDKDNIQQFLDDISSGIERLLESDKESNEIRFLGTVITVDAIKREIQSEDPRALPAAIKQIIDGQQRLSTICLFSVLLYKHLGQIQERIINSINETASIEEKDSLIAEIKEICKYRKRQLADVFSFDLGRGKPGRKPKIIRGNEDRWVLQEDANNSTYLSPISKCLFEYINEFFNDGKVVEVTLSKNTLVQNNLKEVNLWIENIVLRAHTKDCEDKTFPSSKDILKKKIYESYIWQYERVSIKNYLIISDVSKQNSFTYNIYSLIQLLCVCEYLLDRCCFTVIEAANEDWAFDMFQSLNATGTPLTAIETFKPVVVRHTDSDDFKKSPEYSFFLKIEEAFSDSKTAAAKNSRANEILTSFALLARGKKLHSHFSSQRKWLESTYREYQDRGINFVEILSYYAEFYKSAWVNYDGKDKTEWEFITGMTDSSVASILLIFLKDSNHKMSNAILGLAYSQVRIGKGTKADFISTVKLLAAFYITWRSVRSNAGLDNAYRSFFLNNSYFHNQEFSFDKIKSHFINELKKIGVTKKGDWVNKAKAYIKYKEVQKICKIHLYFSSHDAIPDTKIPGLMKRGKKNVNDIFQVGKWLSDSIQTIEHIAPQSNSENGWNSKLYGADELFDSLGNLTLLPQSINSSAGKKSFQSKLYYFKLIGDRDPDKNSSEHSAEEAELIKKLKSAKFFHHIEPLKYLESYDAKFVRSRTERILELSWDVFHKWIFTP